MNAFLNSIGYASWSLLALLAIPLVGALAIWAHGVAGTKDAGDDEVASGMAAFPRMVALLTFIVEFVVSLGLWWSVSPSNEGWSGLVDASWIPSWGIRFTIGVDGIAGMMVLLTTFIMTLALLLTLTTGMLGVFMALDLFLFYVMWEVMLIPMYFIIGIWGGDRRLYASIKFFLYTMIGSLLMLVAILYIGFNIADPATGVPNFSYDAALRNLSLTPAATF